MKSTSENPKLIIPKRSFAVVDTTFLSKKVVKLHLNTQDWKSSLSIKDTTGHSWFQVKKNRSVLYPRITMYDSHENALINISKEPFFTAFPVQMGSSDDEHLYKIVKEGDWFHHKFSTSVCNFANGEIVDVYRKALDRSEQDWYVYIGHPRNKGIPIAHIYRSMPPKGWFHKSGGHEYTVTVAPKVDVAFIVSLTLVKALQ